MKFRQWNPGQWSLPVIIRIIRLAGLYRRQ